MNQSRKLPLILLFLPLALAVALTSGLNSGENERERLLHSALEPFNSKNVEKIRAISSDTSYDTVAEEISSIQTAAAGWSICQLAFHSYSNNRKLSSAEQAQLVDLEELVDKTSLPRESKLGIRKFTSLIIDPLEDGLTLTEVQNYIDSQQCGAVTLPDGQNGIIAEAFRNEL
jgi:hypothetical protein